MRVLAVVATPAEVAPLLSLLRRREDSDARLTGYTGLGHDVDVLVTGVGMVAASAWCARALSRRQYDLALNVGVCGSFRPSLPPGTVVHVVSDRLAELGAEDGDTFLTVQQLGLQGENEFPFTGGRLVNALPPRNALLETLPSVHGITVNTVHGSVASIACVVSRVDPDVESMEGAGFMYACLIQQVPFVQIRAVSNMVERRNRAAWKLDEAIANLAGAARAFLELA